METRRAVLVEPGKFEIVQNNIEPKDRELLVKVEVCGLCNWELNHYTGVTGTCPQTLGHEWAGVVVGMGKDVVGFQPGDHVVAMPVYVGFADYAVIDYEKVIKIRKDLPLKHALGEPLKCVMTVTRATNARPGDYGVIYGCGPMGLWCTQLLASQGLNGLICVDTDEDKLALARKYGATLTVNPMKESVADLLNQVSDGHMADFVIEGTGIPELLNDCVKLLKTTGRGRVILMSSHKRPCKEFDFREMVSRSAELIVPHAKYSENQMEDMWRALKLWEKGTIRMEDIVSHEYELADIAKAFADLYSKPKGYIKGIVVMKDCAR